VRLALVIGLIGLPVTATAADEVLSIEDALGGKILSDKELVPRGLVKVAEAKGDLNGDGIDDIALVLHLGPQAAGDADVLGQSVALFAGDKSGKYSLWKVGDSHFVDSIPDFMEPHGVGVFQIKKGVLTVGSSEMRSAGSWSSSDCTLKWRNGPTGFQLIGLTIVELDRSCACVSSTDVNLLTGLHIYASDTGKGGKKLKKERVVKKKGKPQVVLWEDFDWEEMCAPNPASSSP
jgi:hypothetical protein